MPPDSALVLETCQRIEKACARLLEPRSQAPESETDLDYLEPRLHQAAGNLKTEISKCAVLGLDASSPEMLKPLLQGVQQAAQSLCVICALILMHAGPTLQRTLGSAVQQACSLASACLTNIFVQKASDSHIKKAAGKVLEACKCVENTPVSNHQAISKAIISRLAQLSDAVRELEDLKAESHAGDLQPVESIGLSQGSGSTSCSIAASDDCVADLDFQAQPATAAEADVIEKASDYVNSVETVLRGLSDHIQQQKCGSQDVEEWESLLQWTEQLMEYLNDFIAGLYPPQDAGELSELQEAIQAKLMHIQGNHARASTAEIDRVMEADHVLLTAIQAVTSHS